MVKTPRSREPNILLDAVLEEAGMSYAGLASRINRHTRGTRRPTRYDHTAVARWIRDHAIPRGDVPDIICEILTEKIGNRRIFLADVGMDPQDEETEALPPLRQAVDHAVALWRGDLKNADFLHDVAMIEGPAAVAPVFEWENPPDDVDVSHDGDRAVRSDDLQTLRALRTRYEHMYRRVGGVPVRPRIVATLNGVVAPLVKGSHDDKVGRELMRTAGGLAALAGICAYDAGHQPLAQRYLFQALRMAKASGNKGFGGYVIAVLANQAMFRGKYRQVIQYAETALRGARGHLSPALVTDLHTLQAKAYARAGDRGGTHDQMRRSEHVAANIRPDEEPPETSYVQPGLLEVQHAEALRRLGDLTAARTYAQESVHSADACHLRGQAHRLATLALIYAERGEIPEAVDAANQVLDRAEGMESGRILDRVTGIIRAIRTHDSREVRDFLARFEEQFRRPR